MSGLPSDGPKTTRLRYVSSSDPDKLVLWTNKLGVRVQIYGSPQFNGKKWYLWFVPNDLGEDIAPINLDEV